MQSGNGLPGQGMDKIQDGGGQSKDGDAKIDPPVIIKPFSGQGQQDQRDGQRVEKHQYRQSPGDDGFQTQIRRGEGKDTKAGGPDAEVGRASWRGRGAAAE